MRDLRELDRHRVALPPNIAALWGVQPFGGGLAEICGAFVMPSPIDKRQLRIIAANGDGWDHVSISLSNRCPRWSEMEHVKRAFFRDDEIAMQLHVPPPRPHFASSVLPAPVAPARGRYPAAATCNGGVSFTTPTTGDHHARNFGRSPQGRPAVAAVAAPRRSACGA